MKRFIQMKPQDTVATALVNAQKGDTLAIYNEENLLQTTLIALVDIPFGNKVALADIENDTFVVKYNAPIGKTIKAIKKGELVHVHNVKSCSVDIPYAFKVEIMRQMNIQ